LEETWKALGDPVRRQILDLLHKTDRSTGDLCGALTGLSRFQVMDHLAVLREAGLVDAEKRGRERINRINLDPLREAYDGWFRKYDVEWAGRLGRLKRSVESRQRTKTMDGSVPHSALTTLEIDRSIDIDAPPDRVFQGLTDDIGDWLGPPYVQTGNDAIDIVMDARPGGSLTELTRAGGGVLWAHVQEVSRNRVLALEGRMGMRPAIFARAVFDLIAKGEAATTVRFTLRSVGSFTVDQIDGFTDGWLDLVGIRLKDFVETGVPTGVRARV
jgi:DNA-binding transcriptional ArsR family regulator/uncharacterized protein YndB with AHSA1/START domain